MLGPALVDKASDGPDGLMGAAAFEIGMQRSREVAGRLRTGQLLVLRLRFGPREVKGDWVLKSRCGAAHFTCQAASLNAAQGDHLGTFMKMYGPDGPVDSGLVCYV